MPVTDPNMPEPLRVSIEAMEASVQKTKKALSYAAPEMHDKYWIQLQQGLAQAMVDLHNEVGETPYG